MTVSLPTRIPQLDPRARFGLLFVIWALSFSMIFENWQSLFAAGFMHPVSAVTALLLNALGVATEMDASSLSQGFCLLRMERVTFRVIFECTGIFPLLIFVAAALAYPASLAQKGLGLLLGIVAFFLYSSLRLVLMGVVGQLMPHWIQFSHLWLMVLVHVGFAAFIWLSWVDRVIRSEVADA